MKGLRRCLGRPHFTRLAVAVPGVFQEFTILPAGEERGDQAPGTTPPVRSGPGHQ